jgi:hypothetical protein
VGPGALNRPASGIPRRSPSGALQGCSHHPASPHVHNSKQHRVWAIGSREPWLGRQARPRAVRLAATVLVAAALPCSRARPPAASRKGLETSELVDTLNKPGADWLPTRHVRQGSPTKAKPQHE